MELTFYGRAVTEEDFYKKVKNGDNATELNLDRVMLGMFNEWPASGVPVFNPSNMMTGSHGDFGAYPISITAFNVAKPTRALTATSVVKAICLSPLVNWNSTKAGGYAAGDIVMYNDTCWKFNQAVATGVAPSASNATELDLVSYNGRNYACCPNGSTPLSATMLRANSSHVAGCKDGYYGLYIELNLSQARGNNYLSFRQLGFTNNENNSDRVIAYQSFNPQAVPDTLSGETLKIKVVFVF